MFFSSEGGPGKEKTTKIENYSCKLESGLGVQIDYKKFESAESDPDKVVIFLAGLQMNPDDNTLKNLSESYSESSGRDTYTLQSHLTQKSSEELDDEVDLFYEEARGIADFIKAKGFKDVIIAGYSVGGVRGIDLAHFLRDEPDVTVEGLILLSSPGMYQQEADSIKSNLLRDSIMTPGKVMQEQGSYVKAFKRGLHGAYSLLNVLVKGSKIKREFSEMEQYNQRVEDVDVPVVIIQGAQDQVVEAEKIVPSDIESRDREEYLKENIFKNSPHVKMVVADKYGKHGLPVFRAESVASVSVGLLNRFQRDGQARSE